MTTTENASTERESNVELNGKSITKWENSDENGEKVLLAVENGSGLSEPIIINIGKKNGLDAGSPSNNFRNTDLEKNDDVSENIPPDGGWRAWSIMIGSFIINGVLFSIINTYSFIYRDLQDRLKEQGEHEAATKAALVGSLTIGTTFFLSPVAGMLTDKFGIQVSTFFGGAIAAGGMLLSSYWYEQVEILYLTYGVMFGIGASLAYTPSLVILGHYFKRRLGKVNGIVTTGSSLFTAVLPYPISALLKRYGLEGTLRSFAVLSAVVMLCALLFKPIPVNTPLKDKATDQKKSFGVMMKDVVNVSIWRRKKYVVWACSIPVALIGYFVPYVHITSFVKEEFPEHNEEIAISCIAITSGVGRLIVGYIADLPRVNRILLQQVAFFSIGVSTMLLPLTSSFWVFIALVLCMGLFDGCFITLLGPIAFDICGQAGVSQAIGNLLGMSSIPLTAGPPIAGLLRDNTNSYKIPFILAGISPIVGALLMFLVRCVKEDEPEKLEDNTEAVEESLTYSKRLNG